MSISIFLLFLVFLGTAVKADKLDSAFLALPPVPPFVGNLAPNDRLEQATYLAENQVRGPETLVITSDGTIYTGLANGEVVSISIDGTITKIAYIGNIENETICNVDQTTSSPLCGRPLGIRMVNNILYIADAFYGLVKIDLSNGQKTFILSSNDTRFGDKPLKFTNDLDLDGDVIYFVDTSYLRNVNEFLDEYIEAQPRGRLFSYDQSSNELTLLKEGLYFPNGLQLTPEKDAVLIDECTQARLTKFYVNGENKGNSERFVVLPGFSDTIRLTSNGTLLVPFAVSRYPIYDSILDLLGRFPWIRNLLTWAVSPTEIFNLAPKYGLLVEYDLNGNILRSWQDPTGKIIQSSSSAAIYNGKVYIGSLYINYIGVVDY